MARRPLQADWAHQSHRKENYFRPLPTLSRRVHGPSITGSNRTRQTISAIEEAEGARSRSLAFHAYSGTRLFDICRYGDLVEYDYA